MSDLETTTSDTDSAPEPDVPWPVLVLLGGLALVSLIVMFVGATKVGVTWDERIHAVMLTTYFETGWYASPDWLVNGAPGARLGDWPYYVYAPIAELLTHGMTVLTGTEPWQGFADTKGAYAARHIATALVAVLGLVATGLITRIITRSWKWALVAVALLASIPMWMGHGMFNVKDLPVGSGYTLATLGFVALFRTSYATSWRLRALAYFGIISGALLAVGTRPAAGLPIALTGALMVIVACLFLVVRRTSPTAFPRLGRRILDTSIALVLSYLALVVIYPKGFINPYTLAHETLAISGRFPVNDAVLTAGTWLQQPPPWFYLPVWFGAQLPLLVIALCLLFLVFWIIQVFTRGKLEESLLPIPVALQATLLPLLAILMHSTMYNAVRQFLFVVPATAVLAALGIRALVTWLRGGGGWRTPTRIVVWVVVVLGVLAPVIDQVRLFPYGYVYLNEVATLQPVNGRWATDYWRASTQELVRIIPAEGRESCKSVDSLALLRPCGDESPFEPFWTERGIAAKPGALGAGEYWFVRENGGDLSLPPNCEVHDQLVRPLHGQELIIAQVLKCRT